MIAGSHYLNSLIGCGMTDLHVDSDDITEDGIPIEFPVKGNRFAQVNSQDFKRIPGTPISYWVSDELKESFTKFPLLNKVAKPRQGLATSDDGRFLRLWYEVSREKLSLDASEHQNKKWVPFQKGGSYRRWYGNNEHVINWEADGQEVLNYAAKLYGSPTRTIKNISLYFKPGIAWSIISSGKPSFRYYPSGQIFGHVGPAIFYESDKDRNSLMAILNSSVCKTILGVVSETFKYEVGHVGKVPVRPININSVDVDTIINIHKNDWDSFETSWDFNSHMLLSNIKTGTIADHYLDLIAKLKLRAETALEIENRIDSAVCSEYKTERSELTVNDLTLMSNPMSCDIGKESAVFKSSCLSSLLSFALGCMMGRYSLDQQGLVYANSANEDFDKFVSHGAYKTFSADEDGIIPLTDQEWFKDDATNRFREFVQVVWGDDHLQENLDFVAESLCLNAIKPKKSESALETIRRYLSTQFYKDHLKTYKKRPIYWLFSSGKQKAFECLVYLHRYNEGTLSRMRTEYVTPLLGKYDAYAEQLEKQIETADSTSEANRFKKELDALIKKQVELREFDDKLKHYADMRISLDLDDGVKVNYGKFGDLLADVKAITGKKPEVN
ncbi:BREX-1 system adenine-specific DNA-methyltransferase PglX [Salinivibrio sp. MA607]|uniref:BREX-1 system adenine-specific DNA-methyltransferase PglX n=1 Tax=Salinivibrio sp. MA607 TaxID=1909457 RepID=UPI000D52E78A|nr:BREX-1 system adenine-specific DNA-methyltransferase PglX [Salinivibrio sp. MA607]